LPGRPDIVLSKYRTLVFVHGCFWHGHENCSLFKLPKSRTDFWKGKITGNKTRDARDLAELEHLGWKSIVVWECALKGKRRLPSETLAYRLSEAIQYSHVPVTNVRGTEDLQKD